MKRALAVGAVLALALAIACRIPDRHFQVRGDAGSADAAIDAAPDAMPDANLGPCDLTAPWGALTPVPGLGSARSVARFTADELTAYFALGSDGTAGTTPDTLYVATRSSIGSAFGTPVKLTGVNGSDGMTTPAISPDGSTLFYVWGEPPLHTGGSGSDREIYSATRTGSNYQFGSGSDLPFNIAGSADDFPWVTADGDVWWSSIRASDSGFFAIYRVQSTGGGTFGTISRSSNLNSSTDDDTYVMLDKAQLRAWFMRNSQVWTSTRPSLVGGFSTPVTVDELNSDPVCSGHVCRPAWISQDSCRIYIGGGVAPAGFLMYVASKPANP